tara:strand:- start:601 stop:921 length:321 start_codon:yes stop_codon:yes gene_type:complete
MEKFFEVCSTFPHLLLCSVPDHHPALCHENYMTAEEQRSAMRFCNSCRFGYCMLLNIMKHRHNHSAVVALPIDEWCEGMRPATALLIKYRGIGTEDNPMIIDDTTY